METSALAVGATALIYYLFNLCLFVDSMLSVELAVLAEFHLSLDILSVLGSCVILSLALGALQCNQLYISFLLRCHNIPPDTIKAFGRNRTDDPFLTMEVLYP